MSKRDKKIENIEIQIQKNNEKIQKLQFINFQLNESLNNLRKSPEIPVITDEQKEIQSKEDKKKFEENFNSFKYQLSNRFK